MNKAISRKRERIYLSLILVLGAILRFVRLGRQSFWWDEVYSANLAAKSLGIIMPRFGQTPTLYPILLHFWLYLGRSDTVIRLLSALFGITALWVIYLLGKHILDTKQGLMCALLLAISPFHIWYSQEARMYSLLILLSMASVLFFIKFLQKQRGWPSVWWILMTVFAIYTHYYAAFILFSQMGFILFSWRRYRSRWPQFAYAIATMAVMILPIFFLFFLGGRYVAVYAEGAGGNPLQVFSIPYTFFALSLGFSYGPSVAELHRLTSWTTVQPYLPQILPAALLFTAIFLLGLRSLGREKERLSFLLLYLIVPIAGGCLISLLLPQVSYNVRYVSAALPAYIFILSRGLLAPRNRLTRWALGMLVLLVTLVSVHNHYYQEKYAKSDYRSAAQFVDVYSEADDVILATHLTPFNYYYHGPLVVRSLIWSPAFYQRMITVRVRGFHRAWLVITRECASDPHGEMKGYMRKTFPAVRETTFSNLYLGLFDLTSKKEGGKLLLQSIEQDHEPL